MGNAPQLQLRLHRRQGEALLSRATEILYGGAAGGGKSHLLRVAAIVFSLEIPHLQTYLFRRTYPELVRNHMEGPQGLPVLLHPLIQSKHAKINWGDLQVEFWNGAKIHLCHCQRENDVYRYQGAEIHLLLPDELTLFTAKQLRFLRGRVRMAGIELPEKYRGLFPRIIAGSNPGNVGHNVVKSMFITPQPPMQIWRTPPSEGGMLRQFIPAKLSDNPSIANADEYRMRLQGLGDPSLIRAMEDGDWNIVAGGAVDDLWKESAHVLEPFPIPPSWTISRALDWGSSHPFSVGWWAQSDGTEALMRDGSRRSWPRGTWFRIAEWYGWNGEPNEGCKKLASEVGRGILEKENEMRLAGRVKPGPADSSIFDAEEGDSIAQKFERVGVLWLRADKSPGSRKAGLEEVRSLLTASTKRPMEDKGLFVFNTCRQFIRTVPELPRDADNPDDVDSDAEDHIWDETRYRVMTRSTNAGAARLPFGR